MSWYCDVYVEKTAGEADLCRSPHVMKLFFHEVKAGSDGAFRLRFCSYNCFQCWGGFPGGGGSTSRGFKFIFMMAQISCQYSDQVGCSQLIDGTGWREMGFIQELTMRVKCTLGLCCSL